MCNLENKLNILFSEEKKKKREEEDNLGIFPQKTEPPHPRPQEVLSVILNPTVLYSVVKGEPGARLGTLVSQVAARAP